MKTKQITFHNKDGSTYQGTWKDGKEHGYGIGKEEGCTYEGEWKNGLQYGNGIKSFIQNGLNIKYVGVFKGSSIEEKGFIIINNNSHL